MSSSPYDYSKKKYVAVNTVECWDMPGTGTVRCKLTIKPQQGKKTEEFVTVAFASMSGVDLHTHMGPTGGMTVYRVTGDNMECFIEKDRLRCTTP